MTARGNWERRGVSWENQESWQVSVFTSLYLLLQSYFKIVFRAMFTEKPMKDVDVTLEQIVPSPTKDINMMSLM